MVKNVLALLSAAFLALSPAYALNYDSAMPLPSKIAIIDSGTTSLAQLSTTTKNVQFGKPGTLTGVYISGVIISVGPCTMTMTKNGVTNLLSTANYDLTTVLTNQSASVPLTTDPTALTLAANDVIKITITCGLVSVTPQGIEIAVEAVIP